MCLACWWMTAVLRLIQLMVPSLLMVDPFISRATRSNFLTVLLLMPAVVFTPLDVISSVLVMVEQFLSSPDGIRIWKRPSEEPCNWRALCRHIQDPRVARSTCSPILSISAELTVLPAALISRLLSSNLEVLRPTISAGSEDETARTITWRVLLLWVTSGHRLKPLFSNRVPASLIQCFVVWARTFSFHWFLNLPVIVRRFHWISWPLVLTMVQPRIESKLSASWKY